MLSCRAYGSSGFIDFFLKKNSSAFLLPSLLFCRQIFGQSPVERSLELGRGWLVQSSSSVIRVGPVLQRPMHYCHIHQWMESLAQLDKIQSRYGVPHLSAEPLHVALFILELTNTAVRNSHGSAVIDMASDGGIN